MAQNAENVYVAKPNAAGAVWSAPQGTAVPANAVDVLAEDFHSLGFVSEDGIVNEIEAESETITAFGGEGVMDITTSRKETFTFKPIEMNQYALAEQYGDENVTVDEKGSLAIVHNGKERIAKPYVFEFLLSDTKVKRIVVPKGKIVEVGETTYANGQPVGASLKLAALPDAAGNTAYGYIAEVVA